MKYFWPGTREVAIRSCEFTCFECCWHELVVKSLAYVLAKLISSEVVVRGSTIMYMSRYTILAIHFGLLFRAVGSDSLSVRNLG